MSDRGERISGEQVSNSWVVLVVVSSGLVLYAMTSTTIGIALPYITADFGVSVTTISWVITIFFMIHATLMPVEGRAGDLYGRKKIFIFGMSMFTLMSVFCAMTWNAESLIAGRAVMAIGTAALPPIALAYAYSAFPPEKKPLALGVMGGLLGIAPTAGFLIAGELIEFGNNFDWISWRMIFLINVPLGAVIIPLALKNLKETEPSPEGRDFDYLGAALLVSGLVCLMLVLNKGPEWGWTDTRIIAAFAATPVLLTLFVFRERSCSRPLVSLDLFRYRSLTSSSIVGFFVTGGLFGSMLILPFYFDTVLELSPTWVGLASAPVAITFALFSPVGGMLTTRFGGRTTLILGLLISAAGYLAVSQVLSFDKPQTEAALIVACAVGIVGIGIGLAWAPVDNTAMHDVPADKRGVAGSIPNMSRFIGGSFAGAGITAILSWRLTERLIELGVPAADAEAYTGASEESLSLTYREASTQAYHDVFLITIVFIAAALIAAAFMPQVKKGKEE